MKTTTGYIYTNDGTAVEPTRHCKRCSGGGSYVFHNDGICPYETIGPQGWICPKYNNSNSPYITQCSCNNIRFNVGEWKWWDVTSGSSNSNLLEGIKITIN
tara:strand:+ start:629 stop:931 length:303 start_codon:yes stop_codon:yes gene_type:complete